MSQEITPVSDASPPFFFGVDLGGTNIKIGLVDNEGRTLGFQSIATNKEAGGEQAIHRAANACRKIAEEAGVNLSDVAHVGLGTPGTMDVQRGMLLTPPNLPWRNAPVRDWLSGHLNKPVAFGNDANFAAYGEFWLGGGKEHASMIFLTLGTGIGGGIIIGDTVIEGEHSHGSECGHIIIDFTDGARPCSCGKIGHLEAYASATSVAKRAGELLAAGEVSSLSAAIEEGEDLTSLLVSEHAEQGDPFSRRIVMETANYLGIGVATMVYMIDPSAIILGGAMDFGGPDAALGKEFLARVAEVVKERAFPIPGEKVVIEFAKLGSDAGYLGAAGMARLAHSKR